MRVNSTVFPPRPEDVRTHVLPSHCIDWTWSDIQLNTTNQTVSTEDAFELVADHRRRQILEFLIDSENEAVDVDEVISSISPNRSSPGCTTQRECEQIRIDVYHRLLPVLADADVVDYDPQRATVRYRPTRTVERILQFVTDEFP